MVWDVPTAWVLFAAVLFQESRVFLFSSPPCSCLPRCESSRKLLGRNAIYMEQDTLCRTEHG